MINNKLRLLIPSTIESEFRQLTLKNNIKFEILIFDSSEINALNPSTTRNVDLLWLCSQSPNFNEHWQEGLKLNPQLQIIISLKLGQTETAINAFHRGAFDVVIKPFNHIQIDNTLSRAYDFLQHRERIWQQQSQEIHQSTDSQSLPISESPAMKRTLQRIHQVLNHPVPVLLMGETGTGKSVLANYLHKQSERNQQKFLTVNCGALSPTLLESELFGHEKGAFTGAAHRRTGLLEAADGGTLFLDEINSASPELQVRLLQFIQEKTLLRVGARTEVQVDVQLIFATNQSLQPLVKSGHFREDLFFRLNIYPIEIPSLRNRIEDISYLAARFLFKHSPKLKKQVQSCAPGVLDILQSYHWPGNVRELENVIQRILISCQGNRVELHDLPPEIFTTQQKNFSTSNEKHSSHFSPHPLFPEQATLEEIEQLWIIQTLERFQGNKSAASKALGINPTTLWRKLRS
ncbi:sigma-54 interaction domain-containing protein [Thiomicrorhabdus indica]|uniref:sigma-54 interaction domain-containing protein n=1 Tax=Thiomicrorhabdus indica TaxID=2267253 RepID=UPI00102DBC3F|nr:sigma-54 dependent transcriptional regulator [Thiomicrorhabdus indica]